MVSSLREARAAIFVHDDGGVTVGLGHPSRGELQRFLSDGEPAWRYQPLDARIEAVAFTPDGRAVLAERAWSEARGELVRLEICDDSNGAPHSIPLRREGGGAEAVAVSTDGRIAAVAYDATVELAWLPPARANPEP